MLRKILGVVAGLALAIGVIVAMEMGGHALFPPPEGLDPMNEQDQAAIVAAMPPAAFLYLLLGYAVAVAVGGVAGNRIAQRSWPALIVGAFVALGSVANAFMIPQPIWVNVLSVLVPMAVAFGVSRWAAARTAAA